MIFCLFSKCGKSSNKRLRSLYVTFYLRCKCSTFLGARTPRNARDLPFIGTDNIHEKSSALTLAPTIKNDSIVIVLYQLWLHFVQLLFDSNNYICTYLHYKKWQNQTSRPCVWKIYITLSVHIKGSLTTYMYV